MDILTKNKPLLTSTTFVPGLGGVGGNLNDKNNPELLRFDEQCKEELKKFDMRVILDLDSLVSQQQMTLERAGVPKFFVTNKAEEVRFQMHLIDFIERVKSLKF